MSTQEVYLNAEIHFYDRGYGKQSTAKQIFLKKLIKRQIKCLYKGQEKQHHQLFRFVSHYASRGVKLRILHIRRKAPILCLTSNLVKPSDLLHYQCNINI